MHYLRSFFFGSSFFISYIAWELVLQNDMNLLKLKAVLFEVFVQEKLTISSSVSSFSFF